MKRRNLFTAVFMLICIVLPLLTLAQGPPDPNDAPIDGGLSLLLAAGTAYGVKKYREHKKKHNEDTGQDLKKTF